jgi:hypothetical protein
MLKPPNKSLQPTAPTPSVCGLVDFFIGSPFAQPHLPGLWLSFCR